MSQRLITLGCGYNEELTIFSLRSISIADENKFTARFAEIKDTETAERKSQLEYEILVDGLASWVAEPLTVKKGKEVTPLYDSDLSAADSVRKFFEGKTDDKERLANSIVLQFRSKLQPDVVFY